MTPHKLAPDSLIELQLQVARRADELAAAVRAQSSLNLPCWFQAEEEILGTLRSQARDGRSDRASNHSFAFPPTALA